MFTISRAFPVGPDTNADHYAACRPETYGKWIEAVHKNKTPVAVGDKYLWVEFSLIPPRIYNCLIMVKEGDEYPPAVVV